MIIDLFCGTRTENLFISANKGKPTLGQCCGVISMSLYINPEQEWVDQQWICPVLLDEVIETLAKQDVAVLNLFDISQDRHVRLSLCGPGKGK